jgi:enoyl-CoA hydratase/carnithine racemase
MSSPELIQRTIHGDVVVAHICRPEARNALNRALIQKLHQLVRDLNDANAGACVITAAGPVFCAGGDLKERRAMTDGEVRAVRDDIVELFTALGRSNVPIVAAVNGAARGGGFELALACDFIIAAHDATFALPEVDLGIIPGGGGTQHLVRIAGLPLAREVVLLGRVLTADEAHEARLVHQVVALDLLTATATELAQQLARKPRVALQQARTAIADAWGYEISAALRRENDLYTVCIAEPARRTALDAFAAGTRHR